jgi:hypothetical protein
MIQACQIVNLVAHPPQGRLGPHRLPIALGISVDQRKHADQVVGIADIDDMPVLPLDHTVADAAAVRGDHPAAAVQGLAGDQPEAFRPHRGREEHVDIGIELRHPRFGDFWQKVDLRRVPRLDPVIPRFHAVVDHRQP